MDPTNDAAVAELRAQGLTPKAIARRLGMRPAEVSAIIRANAARAAAPPLVDCLLSPGWSAGLALAPEAQAWRSFDPTPKRGQGLVAVLVSRRERYGKLSVCGYLVDVFCLGVKDALGPKLMDEGRYEALLPQFFAAFKGERVVGPIELAQNLVHGAVEYARQLGFQPCPDFAAAASHLGDVAGPARITFGNHGRPTYVSGPHDDADRVVATLRRTVGDGNFAFTIVAGPDTLSRLAAYR
jgi:hypothetical protein